VFRTNLSASPDQPQNSARLSGCIRLRSAATWEPRGTNDSAEVRVDHAADRMLRAAGAQRRARFVCVCVCGAQPVRSLLTAAAAAAVGPSYLEKEEHTQ